MNLCLDIGNVLVRFDLDKFSNGCEKTKKLLKINHAAIDLGHVLVEDLLGDCKRWQDHLIIDGKMIDYLYTLASKYNVYLLSNIGYEHAEVVRSYYAFNRCVQWFSCDVGLRKPNYLYFKSIVDKYNIDKALFIDDLDLNLKAGSEFFNVRKFNLNQCVGSGVDELSVLIENGYI